MHQTHVLVGFTSVRDWGAVILRRLWTVQWRVGFPTPGSGIVSENFERNTSGIKHEVTVAKRIETFTSFWCVFMTAGNWRQLAPLGYRLQNAQRRSVRKSYGVTRCILLHTWRNANSLTAAVIRVLIVARRKSKVHQKYQLSLISRFAGHLYTTIERVTPVHKLEALVSVIYTVPSSLP